MELSPLTKPRYLDLLRKKAVGVTFKGIKAGRTAPPSSDPLAKACYSLKMPKYRIQSSQTGHYIVSTGAEKSGDKVVTPPIFEPLASVRRQSLFCKLSKLISNVDRHH
jgi:hypothetical protein